jgi:UDP-N-acetylglucosamine--dolichyl-phosphate N-acetylglucosaminephosphotransferase
VPCPRHRLPKFDEATDMVGMSLATFKKSDLKTLGAISLSILRILRLIHLVTKACKIFHLGFLLSEAQP